MSKEKLVLLVDKLGGQSAFCKAVNAQIDRLWSANGWPAENKPKPISQKVVWSWIHRRASPVPPADYVRPIVLAANGVGLLVTAADLRPELYGKLVAAA